MPHIKRTLKEKDLLFGFAQTLTRNGWEYIHSFLKIVIDPASIATTIVKRVASGDDIEWNIPTGLHPSNFKIYRDLNGTDFHVLNEGEHYSVNRITGAVLIHGMGTPETPYNVYIYFPSSGAGSGASVGEYFNAHIGDHYIVKNNNLTQNYRRTLYGIAQYSKVSFPFRFASPLKPFLAPSPADRTVMEIVDIGGVIAKAVKLYKDSSGFTKPSLYTYMLDKYDNPDAITESHSEYVLTMPGDPKQVALDCEVFKNQWYSEELGGLPLSRVMHIFPQNLQSPLIESDYRHEELGYLVFNEQFNTFVNKGNFWADSNVKLKGFVDKSTAFYVLYVDSAPSFEQNATPIIPIYLGEAKSLDGYERDETDISELDVILGGSVPKVPLSAVPNYDFDDTSHSRFLVPLLPLMRDTDDSMGNGLDNAIVRRNKNGARYVKHYISTAVAPNLMPPDRAHDTTGQKYPRAWQQATNSEYSYKFNPSTYTNRVSLGEVYLMHPEEGMRGILRHVLLCNPLSILNEDTLKVTHDFCIDQSLGEGFTNYTYYLVEGMSPFTKRPSVHYRPMGLVILNDILDEGVGEDTGGADPGSGGETPLPGGGGGSGGGKVHFSGVFVHGHNYEFYYHDEVEKLYHEGLFSNILSMGDYPDSQLVIPKAIEHTLDSIAVPPGIKVELFSLANYQSPITTVLGPAILHSNILGVYPNVYFRDLIDGTPFKETYSLDRIKSIDSTKLRGVKSFKISIYDPEID